LLFSIHVRAGAMFFQQEKQARRGRGILRVTDEQNIRDDQTEISRLRGIFCVSPRHRVV